MLILLGIPFLLHEIGIIINPKAYDDKISRIKELSQKGVIERSDRPFLYFNLLYFAWTAIGLFTPNVLTFLAILILSIINSQITSKIEDDNTRISRRRLDSFLSAILIAVLVLSHFYTHFS